MACLIAAESAIFTIFVVAYLFYLGKSLAGPMPKDVLELPLFYSACLLSSSLTIHLAVKSLSRGNYPRFLLLWFFTILLGGLFLFGTAREWHKLIYEHGLKISTNLFGTTYYSLVGLHGFHVSAGLLMLAVALLLAIFGQIRREHTPKVDVLAMYWHFVDAIWVVVFTVVYIIGR
jgi:cytochrome c oxidase subunit 3/cytochrome o ubiquinol oxidase subunit 3